MDSLRCSNLWWLSGMSFLPLILSPRSFPICLSLSSAPVLKHLWGGSKILGDFFFFFFFNPKPMLRFYLNSDALFAVKMQRQQPLVPVDVHVRGRSGSELKLGRSRAFRSHRLYVFIYAWFWSGSSECIIWLGRQTLPRFKLAGFGDGVGLCIPLGHHRCVWRGLLCVTYLH